MLYSIRHCYTTSLQNYQTLNTLISSTDKYSVISFISFTTTTVDFKQAKILLCVSSRYTPYTGWARLNDTNVYFCLQQVNASIELDHFDTYKRHKAPNGSMPILSYLKANTLRGAIDINMTDNLLQTKMKVGVV